MRHINELARLIVEDEYGKVDPNLVIQQNPARFVDAVIAGVPLPELGNEQHQHGDEYESVTTNRHMAIDLIERMWSTETYLAIWKEILFNRRFEDFPQVYGEIMNELDTTEALPDKDTFGHRYVIHNSDLAQYGCPHCNYRSGSTPISGHGAAFWSCGECNQVTVIIADDLDAIPASWTSENNEPVEPHPRQQPARGRTDEKPDKGERFNSRGIGFDYTPGCFVCGGPDGGYSNISGFVQCKSSGERVVAMFERGARLDYREHEPDYVQVKIGACDKHLPCLQELRELTFADSTITAEMVKAAIGG